MEIITKGGNVITCTPEEYAKMVQLGVMPGSGSGTPVAPNIATTLNIPGNTGKLLLESGSAGNIQKLPDDIVPLPEGGSPWKKTIELEPYSAVEKLPDGSTRIKSVECSGSTGDIAQPYKDFMTSLAQECNT